MIRKQREREERVFPQTALAEDRQQFERFVQADSLGNFMMLSTGQSKNSSFEVFLKLAPD